MARIVLVLATFAAIVVAPAHAVPVGNPFLRGVKSPSELASKIDAALDADPTGHSIIDPARCKRDGSCARPTDFLKMFKESDPQAFLISVWDVPKFVRTLEEVSAPEGEYWMACLKAGKPVLHCLSRLFKKAEKVWINPITGRNVLASSCTNPIEKPVPKKCIEVHFFTKEPDTTVRFAILGPSDIADDCVGIKRAGETEWQRWWKDECASLFCNFEGASSVVGQPVQMAGSYVPLPGEHVLRLPAFMAEEIGSGYRVVLCLDRRGEHSDTIGVQWRDYLEFQMTDTKTAYVWYSREEVPPWASKLYWPWGEWSHGK